MVAQTKILDSCTGCKNTYCFQTRKNCSNKINLMIKNDKILEDSILSPFLTIPRTKNTEKITICNSCYHIAHAAQFKQFFFKEKEQYP